MTKDEALKLALEALEGADMIDCDMREAITAIKEALAQPEQEQFALKHRIAELEGAVIGLQAQRTWVGLTDEEMQDLWDRYAHMEMMRAIEAKLKEKNTWK